MRDIKEFKDFYKDIQEANITNLRMDIVLENKEIFEWILRNLDYDFNRLYDTGCGNQELFQYFKIYD